MAMSILDKFGIKETANITFYELDGLGRPTNPVLFIDSAKTSTIEQTAENTSARGGYGNAELISWDFGKEITVSLTDALYSPKSMAIMFGDGSVKDYNSTTQGEVSDSAYLMRTEIFIATSTAPVSTPSVAGWVSTYAGPDGSAYTKVNPKFYDANGVAIDPESTNNSSLASGTKYFCTYDLEVDAKVIEISANTFPGTYYVVGDTYARPYAGGKDEFFQFIIPKAKIQAENTITMEADGDPSVFNLNLRVLRPEDGVMMKLVQYNLINATGEAATITSTIYHNHILNPQTTGNG